LTIVTNSDEGLFANNEVRAQWAKVFARDYGFTLVKTTLKLGGPYKYLYDVGLS